MSRVTLSTSKERGLILQEIHKGTIVSASPHAAIGIANQSKWQKEKTKFSNHFLHFCKLNLCILLSYVPYNLL